MKAQYTREESFSSLYGSELWDGNHFTFSRDGTFPGSKKEASNLLLPFQEVINVTNGNILMIY